MRFRHVLRGLLFREGQKSVAKPADVDLEYDPASFVGVFPEEELRAFEAWLKRNGYGSGRIQFDSAYVEHLRRFHGGVPKKNCFRTDRGRERVVTRMLHFSRLPINHPLHSSNVENSWSLTSDRLGRYLMPFADLFAGDMLCFDYSRKGRPRVVIWLHEESFEDGPRTEFVAANFDEFLTMLYEPPATRHDR